MSSPIPPPGCDPQAPLTDRLFFALRPDQAALDQVAAVLAGLRAAHGLQARPVMPERRHLTMAMVGDFAGIPGQLLARASQVAQEVAHATPPFTASLDTALTFSSRPRSGGRRPLVLSVSDGTTGLHALYQTLSQAMRESGLRSNPPSFTPHLTLMYDGHMVPAQAVSPVAWTVSELLLLHSRIGRNLPYAALGRWPLQGG